jgi:hypothetical protein
VPGLFWENVIQGNCKQLGDQCNKHIYNVTFEGYVPVSKDIVEDISVKGDVLNKWINFLNIDEKIFGLRGELQRRLLVETLRKNLEIAVGHAVNECKSSMRECLQQVGGLPVRDNSPLFKYSFDELMDSTIVPDCEITRIATWMHKAKQMLIIVYKGGNLKPSYKITPYPGECPSGSQIPFIDGDIKEEPLCPADCSFTYSIQKASYYWIPKEYMP